ncbi:MAG TPA: type II toxin-antitoxin system ChpB family toxin [Hyphomicrobiaceae bacterium]
MVRAAGFDRGDIIRVSLNPTVGRELQGGFRPALVLSKRAFNVLGLTLVAPIAQGGNFSRVAGFTVSLAAAGTDTQGVVLVNAVRSMDLQERGGKRIEKAPDFIVDEVLGKLAAIIE